jgi:hypothetical protein
MDEYTDYFMQLMIDLEEQIQEELVDLVEEKEVDDYERELEENDNFTTLSKCLLTGQKTRSDLLKC